MQRRRKRRKIFGEGKSLIDREGEGELLNDPEGRRIKRRRTRRRMKIPIESNSKKNYYGQVHLKAAVNGFSSSSTTDSIRAISSSPSTFT